MDSGVFVVQQVSLLALGVVHSSVQRIEKHKARDIFLASLVGHIAGQMYMHYAVIQQYTVRARSAVRSAEQSSYSLALGGVLALPHYVLGIKVDEVEHYSSVIGIKLSAQALYDLLADYLLRDRITVASLRGHGVVGVGNSDYTGDIGDILAL